MIVRSSLCTASLLLFACTTGVEGSGTAAETRRNVGDFRAIRVDGAINVRFSAGPKSVILNGDDNLLPLVTTEVTSKTLVLTTKEEVDPEFDLVATISAASLEAFHGNGAGNATLEGLDSEQFSVTLDGAGDVELAGESKALRIEINGAGDVAAKGLQAGDVRVEINGAGNAEVYSQRELAVEINGAGRVSYSGKPAKVTQEINGVGGVEAVEPVSLLTFDARSKLDPETVSFLSDEFDSHRSQIQLDRGGKVAVEWSVAKAADGGLYVTKIEVFPIDDAGWKLDASPHGAPINLGEGTGTAVRMMHSIMVTQNRSDLAGKKGAQTIIELHADGTAKKR